MSVTDTTIRTAYEQEGMSPEEIAEDQQLDVVAVKAKLMQVSAKYRKDCSSEPEDESTLNFDNDQLRTVNQIIFEAACSAERSDGTVDWKVRLDAATYIRDDKKGRKEVKRALTNNSFNILSINEKLAEAKGLRAKLIKDAIEV